MRFGINKELPWLKFALPIIIVFMLILGFSGVFFRKVGVDTTFVPKTPMMRHTKVPERVFRGDLSGKKLVALTFDDGPAFDTTSRLLDILRDRGAVATFFELGTRARGNPEITKRVFEEGHEIGNHTMYHQNLAKVPMNEAEDDLNESKGVFREIIGREPSLTRLPYGNSTDFVKEILGTPIIYWSVDTKDWETKDTEKIVENVLSTADDGAIILMHDIYSTTIDAVPIVIDRLREDGYEFVTVSELADYRGVELENGEVYTKFEP